MAPQADVHHALAYDLDRGAGDSGVMEDALGTVHGKADFGGGEMRIKLRRSSIKSRARRWLLKIA